MNYSRVEASAARARIARAWLGAHGQATVGTITLHAHQRAAAGRLRALLADTRGAMLADAVGLGKTYTALAVARDAARLVIVAPASLRAMWREALSAAGATATFVSFQALSRGGATPAADFVIVDEAHHARNPGTRRYRRLASLCADASVLLLSATPVHNRAGDLRAQLALFLGERAWVVSEEELARHVVKRDAADLENTEPAGVLPTASDTRWIDVGDDVDLLREIVGLPAGVPVQDGGDAGALVTLSLVRQWASSRAALRAALRRRLAQATALLAAFAEGRYPTRAQLHAWCYADGALQLAFPQLAADHVVERPEALAADAQRHAAGVQALLRRLAHAPDPDDARADALLRIRAAHPDAPMIVFAEFAATVNALYARLRRYGGVAMLTARGGVVAGGPVSRRELLAQLGPSGARERAPADRVTMLIATDLLSEGVNLQEAAIVVHADLPWSPARGEQRVGRVRRLASRHAQVHVYALRPPAPAEELLQMERRLRDKIAAAARAVGVRGTIMPRLFGIAAHSPPMLRAQTAVTALLDGWRSPDRAATAAAPIVAAVRAERGGMLALLTRPGRVELVADLGRGVSDALDQVLDAAGRAAGPDVPVADAAVDAALARVADWLRDRDSLAVVELASTGPARARRRLLHRIDAIASGSPRHLRGRYLPLARAARRAATSTFGAGAERVLRELAEARMPDDAWLNAVRTFADLHARDDADGTPSAIAVLIVLVPSAWAAPAAAGPP
ncbi:MAG TPA: DEAD/DEAH box helicase [Gemmatimonadaceae bacterium]|nr:DEAD/DEAH box helicase [Gemmatimonadaceae bacterium]